MIAEHFQNVTSTREGGLIDRRVYLQLELEKRGLTDRGLLEGGLIELLWYDTN